MRTFSFAAMFAVFGLTAVRAASAAPTAQVAVSTGPAIPGVASIYTADKLRDPFSAGLGGGSAKAAGPAEFSIHHLVLRGIMKDVAAEYAVFGDNSGGSYMLRQGRLYNYKGKPVDGISGKTNVKKKTASLMTPDKDVQIFRLGEEEKEEKE